MQWTLRMTASGVRRGQPCLADEVSFKLSVKPRAVPTQPTVESRGDGAWS